jgi:hypothetical protein
MLQAIYTSNGGLAEAAEAAAPVAYWKKVTGAFAISGLVLFPAFFLLSFGVAQGKPAIKAWFIDAMMMINLEVRTISRDAARRTDPPPFTATIRARTSRDDDNDLLKPRRSGPSSPA